jgi:hypothetical protein
MTVTEMIEAAAVSMEEINMDITVKTVNYECELELEYGDTYTEKWITEDDDDAAITTIEEWIETLLEEENWDVFEVVTTREDANCWTSVAYDDEGEVIARGTIEGDEY